MKRKRLILILFIFITNISMGAQNHFPEHTSFSGQKHISGKTLPASYQQLKHRLLHVNKMNQNLPIFNFGSRTDYTMLYAAGSLLLITSSFVFLNGYNNENGYFSPCNTGVIIGGGTSTVVFVTKFFIDQYR